MDTYHFTEWSTHRAEKYFAGALWHGRTTKSWALFSNIVQVLLDGIVSKPVTNQKQLYVGVMEAATRMFTRLTYRVLGFLPWAILDRSCKQWVTRIIFRRWRLCGEIQHERMQLKECRNAYRDRRWLESLDSHQWQPFVNDWIFCTKFQSLWKQLSPQSTEVSILL